MGKHNQIWMTAGNNAIEVAIVPLEIIIVKNRALSPFFSLILIPAMFHTFTKSSCIQKLAKMGKERHGSWQMKYKREYWSQQQI
jgi:hypothetical protein